MRATVLIPHGPQGASKPFAISGNRLSSVSHISQLGKRGFLSESKPQRKVSESRTDIAIFPLQALPTLGEQKEKMIESTSRKRHFDSSSSTSSSSSSTSSSDDDRGVSAKRPPSVPTAAAHIGRQSSKKTRKPKRAVEKRDASEEDSVVRKKQTRRMEIKSSDEETDKIKQQLLLVAEKVLPFAERKSTDCQSRLTGQRGNKKSKREMMESLSEDERSFNSSGASHHSKKIINSSPNQQKETSGILQGDHDVDGENENHRGGESESVEPKLDTAASQEQPPAYLASTSTSSAHSAPSSSSSSPSLSPRCNQNDTCISQISSDDDVVILGVIGPGNNRNRTGEPKIETLRQQQQQPQQQSQQQPHRQSHQQQQQQQQPETCTSPIRIDSAIFIQPMRGVQLNPLLNSAQGGERQLQGQVYYQLQQSPEFSPRQSSHQSPVFSQRIQQPVFSTQQQQQQQLPPIYSLQQQQQQQQQQQLPPIFSLQQQQQQQPPPVFSLELRLLSPQQQQQQQQRQQQQPLPVFSLQSQPIFSPQEHQIMNPQQQQMYESIEERLLCQRLQQIRHLHTPQPPPPPVFSSPGLVYLECTAPSQQISLHSNPTSRQSSLQQIETQNLVQKISQQIKENLHQTVRESKEQLEKQVRNRPTSTQSRPSLAIVQKQRSIQRPRSLQEQLQQAKSSLQKKKENPVVQLSLCPPKKVRGQNESAAHNSSKPASSLTAGKSSSRKRSATMATVGKEDRYSITTPSTAEEMRSVLRHIALSKELLPEEEAASKNIFGAVCARWAQRAPDLRRAGLCTNQWTVQQGIPATHRAMNAFAQKCQAPSEKVAQISQNYLLANNQFKPGAQTAKAALATLRALATQPTQIDESHEDGRIFLIGHTIHQWSKKARDLFNVGLCPEKWITHPKECIQSTLKRLGVQQSRVGVGTFYQAIIPEWDKTIAEAAQCSTRPCGNQVWEPINLDESFFTPICQIIAVHSMNEDNTHPRVSPGGVRELALTLVYESDFDINKAKERAYAVMREEKEGSSSPFHIRHKHEKWLQEDDNFVRPKKPEPDRILRSRVRDGNREFLIRWKDDQVRPSWESEQVVTGTAAMQRYQKAESFFAVDILPRGTRSMVLNSEQEGEKNN